MSCDLLTKWLAHYDPIHFGLTAAGITNGVFALVGSGFVRIGGGYNLYRGVGAREAVDWSDPVGAAGADASVVKNFSWRGHSPGEAYYYGLRAIGGGGAEECNTAVFSRVEFDDEGTWVGPAANRVGNLWVAPIAGGKFLVRWTYDKQGEAARPSEFRLYTDGGSGSVNYVTPVGTAAYREGVADYAMESGSFAHGARVRFGVRSATAGGIEERNEATAMGTAISTGPAVHGTVLAERGPETGSGCV